MQVTEVRIKLMEGSEDRLRAFCSITLDHCFVVRDLKIIDGTNGPFVAMPSRKLSGHCYRCNYKNHLRAAFCNQCGAKLKVTVPADLPQKLYADVAHPVNSECRELISSAVLSEFENELARAAQPGYRSRYDDDFDAISESHDDIFSPGTPAGRGEAASRRSESMSEAAVEEQTGHASEPTDRIDRVDQRQPEDGGSGTAPTPHLDPQQRPSPRSSDASQRPESGSGGFGQGIFD